jgi:hypothetical protein
MASIKLGDLLVKAKVLTETQLKAALGEQQRWGGKLGEILVRMNALTEEMLVKALSKQLGLQTVNLDAIQSIFPHVKAKIPKDIARDLSALPLQLRDDGRTLVVAMAEPQQVEHIDTLRAVSRARIVPQLAGRTAIARAFSRFYENNAELSDQESSFKMVDAQGKTILKTAHQVKEEAGKTKADASLNTLELNDEARPSPRDVLAFLEEGHRREVAALKAMVELLIERGVFTREEYLNKVKR